MILIKVSKGMHSKSDLCNNILVKPDIFIQKDRSSVKTGKSTKPSHEVACHPRGLPRSSKGKHLSVSSLSPLVNALPHKLFIPLDLEDARMLL